MRLLWCRWDNMGTCICIDKRLLWWTLGDDDPMERSSSCLIRVMLMKSHDMGNRSCGWDRSVNCPSVMILMAEMMMVCGNAHVISWVVLRMMMLPSKDDLAVVVVVWSRWHRSICSLIMRMINFGRSCRWGWWQIKWSHTMRSSHCCRRCCHINNRCLMNSCLMSYLNCRGSSVAMYFR